MRYTCVAFDYDGTLASDGRVPEDVLLALSKVKQTGRVLVLVTGRRLNELLKIFSHVTIFDLVICENGAVLYDPLTKVVKLLAEPPALEFINNLRARGIDNLEIGQVVVATWHPHETIAIEVIQEMGLDLHITFNKGAVMILPPEINKGSGLRAAISELNISSHNTLSVGDAENDLAMFAASECSAAVANALPNVKSHASITTRADHGEGVIELLNRLLETDLIECEQVVRQHQIGLGTTDDGKVLEFNSYNCSILLAGPSKSGKSTIAMSLLENMAACGYQYCVIDPEGEYHRAPKAVLIGNQHYAPDVSDIVHALDNPADNVVVNLLSVDLNERPAFLGRLVCALQDMRRTRGRPHWIVVDEAHHMLHPYWDETLEPEWSELGSIVLITVDPAEISRRVLSEIDLVLAVGRDTSKTFKSFADHIGQRAPEDAKDVPGWGTAVAWFRHEHMLPVRMSIGVTPVEHQRHMRKYAAGDVGSQRSFYFTGPENRFKIRCQNLFLFLQISDGLDDSTWNFHLRRGDFSNWFRDIIRDPSLANETCQLETNNSLSAFETRQRIRKLIEQRYSPPTKLLG